MSGLQTAELGQAQKGTTPASPLLTSTKQTFTDPHHISLAWFSGWDHRDKCSEMLGRRWNFSSFLCKGIKCWGNSWRACVHRPIRLGPRAPLFEPLHGMGAVLKCPWGAGIGCVSLGKLKINKRCRSPNEAEAYDSHSLTYWTYVRVLVELMRRQRLKTPPRAPPFLQAFFWAVPTANACPGALNHAQESEAAPPAPRPWCPTAHLRTCPQKGLAFGRALLSPS